MNHEDLLDGLGGTWRNDYDVEYETHNRVDDTNLTATFTT